MIITCTLNNVQLPASLFYESDSQLMNDDGISSGIENLSGKLSLLRPPTNLDKNVFEIKFPNKIDKFF